MPNIPTLPEYTLSKRLLSKIIQFDEEKFNKYFIEESFRYSNSFSDSTNEWYIRIGNPMKIREQFTIKYAYADNRFAIHHMGGEIISCYNIHAEDDYNCLYSYFIEAIRVLQEFIIKKNEKQV